MRRVSVWILVLAALSGCSVINDEFSFAAQQEDGGRDADVDGGLDAGPLDAGNNTDAGRDAGFDGGSDGGMDAGPVPWCSTRSRPSDVLPTDYECVAFDSGLPADWTATVMETAQLEATTTAASSPPMSMLTTVPDAATFSDRRSALIEWSAVGTAPVSSVRLRAQLNPAALPSVAPPWSGYIRLLCVEFGGGEVCLAYTYDSIRDFASSYEGLFITWSFFEGAALFGECEVTEDLDDRLWNEVVLAVGRGGDVEVDIDGVDATSGCTATALSADADALVTVGQRVFHQTGSEWTVYFDNVEVEVRR
ncbi:MAG TPA: hypothetical protein RMH99_30745 [Sandaracinaceae bacterium LLY-WYZ-13_1]|nr:hypothetical protein [Sandaracinaceae bacterium LLY-WYZ-13_1]